MAKTYTKIIQECERCPARSTRHLDRGVKTECEYTLSKDEDGRMSGRLIPEEDIWRDRSRTLPKFPSWCPLKDN